MATTPNLCSQANAEWSVVELLMPTQYQSERRAQLPHSDDVLQYQRSKWFGCEVPNGF